MTQRQVLVLAVVIGILLAAADSQDSERRSVTEHQYLHDRGRAAQSLKRLMWLSGAMGALHTASPRDLQDPREPSDPGLASKDDQGGASCRGQALHQLLLSLLGRGEPARGPAETLWESLHRPHLASATQENQ
ncbi:parathyroid hormone 4 isoform X2 [Amia ocellicauda]